ncbi:MAG: adenylate/guanylate cyclase domain-containing protein [Sideroxydans sp.]|nr:adenylate/guanylate cyclase domain-containing protein [Sideroxydans sp.]
MELKLGALKLANEKARIGLGFVVCLLVTAGLTFSHLSENLNRKILDRQFVFLRDHYPHPVANDVVIVGIDEATFKTFKEPYELWHPHFAKFLQAMSRAKPSVVGIDVALPEHSYDFLIPKYDQNLTQGLLALKAQSPIVLGQLLDENGNFRSVYAPFIEASGTNALATVVVCSEADKVARFADPNQCTVNAQGATLTEAMAVQLGRKQPSRGLVDFRVGDELTYIPFQKVLDWAENGDDEQMRNAFAGKPVLLGMILPFEDRVNLPVVLAAWEPENRHVSTVVWHAQALRSMLERGLIQESHHDLVLALSLLAALLWFARLHWFKFVSLVIFPIVLLAYSTWHLSQAAYLPVGGILLSGFAAFGLRSIYELILKARENKELRGIFGSYVSAETLRELIAGGVKSRLEGERKRVCILFADIHNFGARSESSSPKEVVALLNEYFTEMTVAIHQHNGTASKFIGDAIMACFGAPQALECPEKNALEAAQAMLLRVRQVNARLKEQGIAPIEIGIGLHVGDVVIGHIGSEARHEYTAIGEVVSMAAKLEELTKTLGYPVVCSRAVAERVELSGGLTELGEQTMKGNAVLSVCGWYPPLLAAN